MECERCLWAARERGWGPARLVTLARRLLPAACSPHGGASPPYSRGTSYHQHVEPPRKYTSKHLYSTSVSVKLRGSPIPRFHCLPTTQTLAFRFFQILKAFRTAEGGCSVSRTNRELDVTVKLPFTFGYHSRIFSHSGRVCSDVYDSAQGLQSML